MLPSRQILKKIIFITYSLGSGQFESHFITKQEIISFLGC